MTSSQALFQPLKNDEIVPHVVTSLPPDIQLLNVSYGSKAVQPGSELTATQVQSAPTALSWPVQDSTSLYTLLMVDPDAPSRRKPRARNIVQWLVVNVRGNDLSTGETSAPYIGVGPPKGSGLHRYVFLIFKQSSKIDTSRLPGFRFLQRSGYSADKLTSTLQKAGSGAVQLVAANYFLAQFDESVPPHTREILGAFTPVFNVMTRMMML